MTSTTTVPAVALRGGTSIPQLGFGVFQVPDGEAAHVVSLALDAGYRSIDTAAAYGNEKGVGAGIAASGLPRDEVFVTSKLWIDAMAREAVRPAFEQSLERLGLERLDLYLIHWPVPGAGRFVEAWEELVALREAGLVREIGVSNFTAAHLDAVVAATGVTPAVNQVELHPAFAQRALREHHRELGIVTEAWSPLGQGTVLGDPVLGAIAGAHDVTPAQVVLRWHLQAGTVAIPKSVTPERIASNLDVLGFELSAEQVAAIDGLDRADGRIGPDPDAFNG